MKVPILTAESLNNAFLPQRQELVNTYVDRLCFLSLPFKVVLHIYLTLSLLCLGVRSGVVLGEERK